MEYDLKHIWQNYAQGLRAFVASHLRGNADVEDVVQEILIKSHRGLKDLKDPAKLRPWIYRIARNAIMDHLRRQKGQHVGLPENLPEEGPDASNREELGACVRCFLDDLPEPYRTALIQADLKDVSQKEMAEREGISHSAIKSRVQRGRAKLKDLFARCCQYDLDARGRLIEVAPKDPNCC